MPRSAVIEAAASPAPAERVVGALAFATVAITTWGWAGRADWAPAFFSVAALAAAVCAVWLTRREGLRVSRAAFAPFLVFCLLVGSSLLNPSYAPVPGPPGAWAPRAEHVWWLPGTAHPGMSLEKALPWAAALLLGGALRQAALGRSTARALLAALLIHGLAVALTGVYFHFAEPGSLLGLARSRHGYHFASFAYRNHWAAYVLVLLPVALGFAFSALRRWRAERERLDAILPGLAAALLLAVTLPMPGSRSGTLVAALVLLVALGLLSFGLWQGPARRSRDVARRGLVPAIVLGFAALIVAAGLAINRPALEKHWERTQAQWRAVGAGGEDLRLRLTRDTLRMASDQPVWGWGVGSYGLVFPTLYQGDYLRDAQGRVTTHVVHAHNDWAQVAAEMGVVGLLALAWPTGVLLLRGLRAESPLSRWSAAGAGLVAVYALADFPLHCPAVLLLWTTVLCVAAPSRTTATS